MRAAACWCDVTLCHHPLPCLCVVLKDVQSQEKALRPTVQTAARMLWAAVDSGSSYEAFLTVLHREFPNVLLRLHPLIVQYYVHLAAGLAESDPSIIVFVWDEANAVPDHSDLHQPTFFQLQLSEVVSSRRSALEARRDVDVLLVPVVASTRGSAMSLVRTACMKAGSTDLRLPLIQSVDDLATIAMDLLRRLPLPMPIRESLKLGARGLALSEVRSLHVVCLFPLGGRASFLWVCHMRATFAAPVLKYNLHLLPSISCNRCSPSSRATARTT